MLNAAVPFIFEILADHELWYSALFAIQVTVVRSLILRFVSLYAFFISIMAKKDDYACWETYLGQSIYQCFVAGSLLFEIFTSGLLDMLITLAYKHVPCIRVVFKTPAYFDTVKKLLELTMAQSLIWFGAFFCPLLPIVGIIRCIILFYVQVCPVNLKFYHRAPFFQNGAKSGFEMCFGPSTLGAGAKTRLHTPKAVTYHEQYRLL